MPPSRSTMRGGKCRRSPCHMSDVISMLTNESMQLPLPTKPAFYTEKNPATTGIHRRGPPIISIDDLSNTDLEGR